jgi:HEAT repeat protein
VLGEISKLDNNRGHRLPADTKLQIEQALIRGTGDEDVGVRIVAVQSLGKAGNRDAVELLERIAQSDLAGFPARVAGENRYPVREEALKAISLIKNEQKRNPR